MAEDDEIVCVEPTREEAIEACIGLACADAREIEEVVEIICCCAPVGSDCPTRGPDNQCAMCERIFVFPDGSVKREPKGA